MNYENIIFNVENHVARITINRPPLNILDIKTLSELIQAFKEIPKLEALKAIVITGAGTKSFSAGVSIQDHLPKDVETMIPFFDGMFREMIKFQAPTIAVVNGWALGGGAELALFCDMVIASEKSQIGQVDITLGGFAPLALAAYPFYINKKKCYEMLFLGDKVSAAEAEKMGLVNWVVPEEKLKEKEEEVVGKLRKLSSVAIAASKRAMALTFNNAFKIVLDDTEKIYMDSFPKSEDYVEGLTSYLEKRSPVWKEK